MLVEKPLLQRLLYPESSNINYDNYIECIQQDVLGLLNSVCAGFSWDEAFGYLSCSVFNYGLPNQFQNNYAKLCDDIKQAIDFNEPRLNNTNVFICDESRSKTIFYLNIESSLHNHMQTIFELKLNSINNKISFDYE